MFQLHPQLEKDCLPIGDLPLSRLLLMNNRLFPWCILVPRLEGAREWVDLDTYNQADLNKEVNQVTLAMRELFAPYKFNIAALGNQVEQLHVHVIARFKEDAAWPNPVWGRDGEVYEPKAAESLIKKLQTLLIK